MAQLRASGLETAAASTDTVVELVDADVVVSDYSGVSFDAIYFGKPVVLIQEEKPPLGDEKLSEDSLEIGRRSELGGVVTRPAQLRSAIQNALAEGSGRRPIFEELFVSGPGATEAASKALVALVGGEYEPSEQHLTHRRAVRRRLAREAEVRGLGRWAKLARAFR